MRYSSCIQAIGVLDVCERNLPFANTSSAAKAHGKQQPAEGAESAKSTAPGWLDSKAAKYCSGILNYNTLSHSNERIKQMPTLSQLIAMTFREARDAPLVSAVILILLVGGVAWLLS